MTMKHIRIENACSENWSKMTATEKGAFCQKCCKQVIDFSKQSNDEIRSILHKNKGEEVCGRITNEQLNDLNLEFESWRSSNTWSIQRASFYAFLFVFGLSMVSCDQKEDEQHIVQLQHAAKILIKNRSVSTYNNTLIINSPSDTDEQLHEDIESLIEPEIKKICSIENKMRDTVILREIERFEVTMGAMVWHETYDEYLEEIVPEEDKRDEKGRLIPTTFKAVAFPNPTEGRTTLTFEVPEATNALFTLYSMNGSMIRSMGASDFQPGTHEIPFDLTSVKPGTYVMIIQSKHYNESVRIVKI